MTRPSITDIIGIQDFAVLYRWEVIITPPTALASYAASDLNVHAVSSEYPKYSNDEIEVSLAGHKVYQAGMRTYDPFTLTFVEDTKGTIQNFIKDWGSLMWTPGTGTQVAKSAYVAPTILLRPLDASNNAIHTYTLYNVWMQTHTIGNPDGGSNEVIKPEVTLRYDYLTEDGQAISSIISNATNLINLL